MSQRLKRPVHFLEKMGEIVKKNRKFRNFLRNFFEFSLNFHVKFKLISVIFFEFFVIKKVLISYFNSKNYFNKIFIKDNMLIIENNINFIKIYKSLIQNYKNNINFCLKLFNNENEKYINMKEFNLIKIKNNTYIKKLCKNIENNQIFILNKNNKYFISYGKVITNKLNENDFGNMFFKNYLNKSLKENSNYNDFYNYDNLSIYFWISTELIL
jgi:hypothetical protein